MTIYGKKEPIILLLGDILVFLVSLWLTLLVRYLEVPGGDIWYNHFVPFSFLFIVWLLVFAIAGLYRKHTVLFKRKLPGVILRAQIINILLAATFFFAIPYFGIAPKTNLLIYLIISFGVIVYWRLILVHKISKKRTQRTLIIGSGAEMREVSEEVNNNTIYSLEFVASIDLDEVNPNELVSGVEEAVHDTKVSAIVIDAKDERVVPALPALYSHLFSDIQFIDLSRVYEDIFERVPVPFVTNNWLIDNLALSSKPFYDVSKRIFDIVVSTILLIPSLLVYPFVFIAMRMEGKGELFSIQERVGKNNRPVKLFKFRTMTFANDMGKWDDSVKNEVTKVGDFLRRTRIDELPQLWNVLGGSLSLIGPRSEFQDAVNKYAEEIPYYNARHLIKPGLSGWAQIQGEHPHHGIDFSKTANKLSYDLYYVKNRSIFLDIQIALQTVKTLLSRSGL